MDEDEYVVFEEWRKILYHDWGKDNASQKYDISRMLGASPDFSQAFLDDNT